MPFVPTPNSVEAVIQYGIVGETPMSNSLWFSRPSFDLSEMEDLANAVSAVWRAGVLGLLSSNIQFNQIEVIDQRTVGAPSVISTVGAGQAGGTGPTLANTRGALVVTFRTQDRGRFARGRNYVRGFDEAAMGAQEIAQNIADGVLATYRDILLLQPPVGWTSVVRSKQENGVALDPAKTRAITEVLVRSVIMGSQRRSYSRP